MSLLRRSYTVHQAVRKVSPNMFRHGARSFATSARYLAAAAEPSQHLISVSKAQGIAKGLTGGNISPLLINKPNIKTNKSPTIL